MGSTESFLGRVASNNQKEMSEDTTTELPDPSESPPPFLGRSALDELEEEVKHAIIKVRSDQMRDFWNPTRKAFAEGWIKALENVVLRIHGIAAQRTESVARNERSDPRND